MTEITIDENFIAGYVVGEGSFWITQNNSGYTFGFSIKIRDDDRELLELIQARLGVGKIYTVDNKYPDKNNIKREKSIVLMVRKKSEIVKLIDFFDTHRLYGRKLDNYELWKLAVWYNKNKNFEMVEKIKENMNKYRVCGAEAAVEKFSVKLN